MPLPEFLAHGSVGWLDVGCQSFAEQGDAFTVEQFLQDRELFFLNLADLTTDLREADGKASVTSPASDSCDWAEGSEEAEACEVAMDIDAQRQSPRAKRAGADVETGIEVK